MFCSSPPSVTSAVLLLVGLAQPGDDTPKASAMAVAMTVLFMDDPSQDGTAQCRVSPTPLQIPGQITKKTHHHDFHGQFTNDAYSMNIYQYSICHTLEAVWRFATDHHDEPRPMNPALIHSLTHCHIAVTARA